MRIPRPSASPVSLAQRGFMTRRLRGAGPRQPDAEDEYEAALDVEGLATEAGADLECHPSRRQPCPDLEREWPRFGQPDIR